MSKAFSIGFVMLLGGGVFAASTLFVTPEISTKYHFVVLLAFAGGLCALGQRIFNPSPIHIGKSLCWVSFCIAVIVIRIVCSDTFDMRVLLPFVCGWLLFFIWYQLPDNMPIVQKTISVAVGCMAIAQVFYQCMEKFVNSHLLSCCGRNYIISIKNGIIGNRMYGYFVLEVMLSLAKSLEKTLFMVENRIMGKKILRRVFAPFRDNCKANTLPPT